MSDRHALAPLRRWFLESGTPAKLTAMFVVAVLMIAASVLLFNSATGEGDSGLIEIEGPAATG